MAALDQRMGILYNGGLRNEYMYGCMYVFELGVLTKGLSDWGLQPLEPMFLERRYLVPYESGLCQTRLPGTYYLYTARWQKQLDAAYKCNVYHPTQTHTKVSNMQCLGLFMQGGCPILFAT